MDLHILKRRHLQSLCKKNNIQANMTNASMADVLSSLPTFEYEYSAHQVMDPSINAEDAIKLSENVNSFSIVVPLEGRSGNTVRASHR